MFDWRHVLLKNSARKIRLKVSGTWNVCSEEERWKPVISLIDVTDKCVQQKMKERSTSEHFGRFNKKDLFMEKTTNLPEKLYFSCSSFCAAL